MKHLVATRAVFEVRFGYVVQGRAAEVARLLDVFAGRSRSMLTWDEPCPGADFIPGTSWSEGRRIGLERLREGPGWAELAYVVFLDADAHPTRQQLDDFEGEVARLRPAVAVPVVERLVGTADLVTRSWQLPLETDEQFQAYRRELLEEFFAGSPYSSAYDDRSWWYPCIVNQSVLRKHFGRSTVQINSVRVGNASHSAYPNRFDPAYIDAELRRLRIRQILPLGAYERGAVGLFPHLTKRRRRRVDRLVARVLAVLSPLLYRPWDRSRPGRPSTEYLEVLAATSGGGGLGSVGSVEQGDS